MKIKINKNKITMKKAKDLLTLKFGKRKKQTSEKSTNKMAEGSPHQLFNIEPPSRNPAHKKKYLHLNIAYFYLGRRPCVGFETKFLFTF